MTTAPGCKLRIGGTSHGWLPPLPSPLPSTLSKTPPGSLIFLYLSGCASVFNLLSGVEKVCDYFDFEVLRNFIPFHFLFHLPSFLPEDLIGLRGADLVWSPALFW